MATTEKTTREKKRSILRKLLYIAGGLLAILAIGVWIFLTFFLDDVLNKQITPKLDDAVYSTSHGRYTLAVGHIGYSHGSVLGTNIDLYRSRYDSNEVGIVVKRLTIDTVQFSGIDWWALLLGKGLFLGSMEINTPKAYLTDASDEESSKDLMAKSTPAHSAVAKPDSLPHAVPVISVGQIHLNGISLFLPGDTIRAKESLDHAHGSFENVSLALTNFYLDAKSLKEQPAFFSKRVEFTLPSVHYNLGDGTFALDARNIHGILTDSVLAIDSVSYTSKYSHDEFAARQKYITGQLDFHCANVRLRGIDFPSLLTARGIVFRTLEAKSWSVFFYADKRRPIDPHPPVAVLPNELVTSHHFAIDLDSIILGDGHIGVSERMPGSARAGLLTFDRANISAHPFSTDSLSPRFGVPTRIGIDAYFVGEAHVLGVAVYPLQHKSFDLELDATVGKFSALRLNSWLITNERKELTDGEVESGDIHMHIRSGVGTTSVTPKYRNLSIKVLNETTGKGRGLLEGISTFVANTFMMRTNNLDENGKKAMTGTTVRVRARDEEFMQFIWLALRKSLGKVVGGFQ